MRPGDRRTKTMDRDPNTEGKAQCLAELSRLSLPDNRIGIAIQVSQRGDLAHLSALSAVVCYGATGVAATVIRHDTPTRNQRAAR